MLLKIKNLIKPLIFTFLLFNASFISAQNGTIKGRITDKSNNEPLIGASAIIVETSTGGASDFDGNYTIGNVKPGKYTIKISYISYKPIQQNVVVEANKETVLDVQLESADVNLKEVEVVAKANRESENILLLEQKKSLVATQAVGAKEMSRKGISDAEAAVAQVSGISKQEGVKNVFVRGLGDRYNFTTFNGLPIPSEDPEYKNISLDFFGSDIIQNVAINKVFSANDYGDIGGAHVDINSKQLLTERQLSIDLSAGINTKTFGSKMLKMDGVNYWGVAHSIQPYTSYKTDYNFGSSLNPTTVILPINYSYGFSAGKKFNIGEYKNPLSFLIVGNYSTKYTHTKENLYDSTTDGTIYKNLNGTKSTQNINQLVLGNINYMFSGKNEINYNFLLIHDNNQYVGEYTGMNSDMFKSNENTNYAYKGYLNRQQTNDNLLIVNQFSSFIKLSDKFDINLAAGYNYVNGNEPDRRTNALVQKSATQFIPESGDGHFVRNYETLKEKDYNLKFDLKYTLSKRFESDRSGIHIGYNGRYVTDDFNATQYMYYPFFTMLDAQNIDSLDLDKLYNQANLEAKKFEGGFYRISTYTVHKMINSAYLMADYQVNSKLTINAGLKEDIVHLYINYDILNKQAYGTNTLNRNYLLPSVNLKYDINSKHTLRLGLSKSYTLPQSKEISPYQYLGLEFSSAGNEKLKPSDNYNADLKWDFYITPSELLSVTTYYKYIKNPIARAYLGSAGGIFSYSNISNHAAVAGIEIETRKNIINNNDLRNEKINKLSIGLNASYLYSNMWVDASGSTAPRYSQLEGAAPVILNGDLSYLYSHKSYSFTNSLVINYNSDRIYTIGMQSFNDVIEKGVPTLNFVSIAQVNKHLSFKLKINNILDPQYQFTRKTIDGKTNQILHSYNKGMNLDAGFSYEF